MLARRIAAATTAVTAAIVAPAAAGAAPIVRHASEGPSATPLLVELGAAALVAAIALTRKPVARLIRASLARRARRRVPKPARAGGR